MKTYCGKTLEQMHKILDTMCDLEDFCDIDSEEQQEAFDIAIQCVTSVINTMVDENHMKDMIEEQDMI